MPRTAAHQVSIEKIKEAARVIGGQVRSYSGRFMFGRECIGVVTTEPLNLAAVAQVKEAKTDHMGWGQ